MKEMEQKELEGRTCRMQHAKLSIQKTINEKTTTYRTHRINNLKCLLGTWLLAKISANRSKPRPLLVVHSGKIATGRSAFVRMASRDRTCSDTAVVRGTRPDEATMAKSETCRKPLIGIRGAATRFGDAIFAEPVPVLRPGLLVIGDEPCVSMFAFMIISTPSKTGMINIGLYDAASQTISIQETQLDTSTSPCFGDHFSTAVVELLRVIQP